MKFDEFVGNVQNRGRMASSGEAVTAIRATLKTLGQRLHGGAAENLAAQLPKEVGVYLDSVSDEDEVFSVDEFFDRVAEVSETNKPQAVYHARAVLSVLQDAVSQGEIDKMMDQLPEEWDPLFEAGAEGNLKTA